MPFIGKDWRSPGEAWVKTESLGWQRMKIIESQLLPTCQQSHPACSWPPQAQFGQHMAKNCNNRSNIVAGCGGRLSSDNSGGCSSSDSSRTGSASTSPTGSPEKNNGHHLHPITISSPYGRYSCYAHHHQTLEPPVSPSGSSKSDGSTASNPDYKDNAKNMNENHLPGAQLSRSLSREFLQSAAQEAGTRNIIGQKLRFNNSCSDLSGISLNQRANNDCSTDDQAIVPAPHCRISVRTREVAMYQTISEAFYRLDFCNAIHDIRRFNYICKLLHLLITQNLTSLSGCATKVLFTMLEQVAWEVSTNKRNIHVLKNLLSELKQMIQKYYCWGRPIGSSVLWQQHFDTIERISQIVEGIDLSPPIDDGKRITFDKLPTEMVREILFRLNDYRDLVNSAQASPLMQTMIDSQYIWQKLCRYHFSEQQLRLALKSYDLSKSNSLCGVKYARTTFANGQGSFRNPVAHNNHKSSTTGASSARQQIEQTSNRRRANQASSNPSQASSSRPETSPSYVTETIRIFNQDGSSPSASCSNRSCDTRPNVAQKNCKNDNSCSPKEDIVNTKMVKKQQYGSDTDSANRADSGLDWESVFHQLRKKYDLKEEYADCLLLCRHCRCLFWKSFGHPCIKNDEPLPEQGFCASLASNNQSSGSAARAADASDSTRNQINRPNVATLSRNFDRGFHLEDIENVRPSSSSQLNLVGPPNRHQIRQSPNALLRAQLDHEISLNNNNGLRVVNQANNNASVTRQDELIPKHVTITPQAFLKFFSL